MPIAVIDVGGATIQRTANVGEDLAGALPKHGHGPNDDDRNHHEDERVLNQTLASNNFGEVEDAGINVAEGAKERGWRTVGWGGMNVHSGRSPV
jgi:hypothetical protein